MAGGESGEQAMGQQRDRDDEGDQTEKAKALHLPFDPKPGFVCMRVEAVLSLVTH